MKLGKDFQIFSVAEQKDRTSFGKWMSWKGRRLIENLSVRIVMLVDGFAHSRFVFVIVKTLQKEDFSCRYHNKIRLCADLGSA